MGLLVFLVFCEPGTPNPSFLMSLSCHLGRSCILPNEIVVWDYETVIESGTVPLLPFCFSVPLIAALQHSASFLRGEQGQAGTEIVIC